MQVVSKPDIAGEFERLVLKELPTRRGLMAWQALLRAHATLTRQLDQDLEKETGLALADFDVLAQLALTDAGVARLIETIPVHSRGVFDLFVSRLDDQELAVLESALGKVTLDSTFG